MKSRIVKLFMLLWIVVKDEQHGHRFNVWNPIGWVLLLLVAVFAGIEEGILASARFIRDVL